MAESSDTTVSLHVPSWATALQVVWWTLVESFLQSMMDGAHRCRNRIAAAGSPCRERPPAIVRLDIFLPRPNGCGFSSAKPFHHGEIQHTTALLLSPGCCATSHHPAKATFAAFRLPTRLRFTLRRSWTLPAKASLKPIPHHIRLHCSTLATSTAAALLPPHIIATCDGVIECPCEVSSLPHLLTTRAYSGHSHARFAIACA